MFRSSIPLRKKAPKIAVNVPKLNYDVLVAFSYKNLMLVADTIVQMTEAEAKYHLLAKRIRLHTSNVTKA